MVGSKAAPRLLLALFTVMAIAVPSLAVAGNAGPSPQAPAADAPAAAQQAAETLDCTSVLSVLDAAPDRQIDDGQALIAYQIADGEATITSISKSPSCTAETYAAYIPDVVIEDGKSYLVTAIADNAAGTSVEVSPQFSTSNLVDDRSLASVSLPGKILSIGQQAFVGCRALATLDLRADPETGSSHLETVGRHAFFLTGLESLYLPDSLKEAGLYAFAYIDALRTLRLPASQTDWEQLSSYPGGTCFDGSDKISELTIPEGCVTVPALAAYGLKDLAIPSSVEGFVKISTRSVTALSVSEDARITDLYLTVGAVKGVTIPKTVKTVSLVASCNAVTLPQGLETITTLNISGMRTLEVPASVTTIGSIALSNSRNLESVTFAEGSKLRAIGHRAFSNCSKLSGLALPEGVEELGNGAFKGCDSLVSVIIPSSVRNCDFPFVECAGLKSIEFAAGSRIRAYPRIARDCPALEELVLPGGLDDVCGTVLSGCSALKDVYAFNSDMTVEAGTFGDAEGFTVHCWGQEGRLVDSCEELGLSFVPYAELDASAKCGKANVRVVAVEVGIELQCSFDAALNTPSAWRLEEGVDYLVEEGFAVGNGRTCFGQMELPVAHDISKADIVPMGAQLLVVERCEPIPEVRDGGSLLRRGVDYRVFYEGNDAAGTAVAHIEGIGLSSGSQDVSFRVVGCQQEVLGAGEHVSPSEIASEASAGSDGSRCVVVNPGCAQLLLPVAAYARSTGSTMVLADEDGTLDEASQAVVSQSEYALAVGSVMSVDAGVACSDRIASDSAVEASEALLERLAGQTDDMQLSICFVSDGSASALTTKAGVAAALGCGCVVAVSVDGPLPAVANALKGSASNLVLLGYGSEIAVLQELALAGVEG